ncbi:TrkH family potassium uptake protein [Staphylothermus hellenicus]|uniref:Cation transporter n=1 Tax=Staphylothermus hellenicus (strain DSM 12710 / JCM 10830 / BK20S6-10-b1 / P8) TaxID=591019 RepID=D7D9L3_STAHD|nr:TrkH family potassium uptake protein [Staphylothermus hellenicus]ADI32459.1 cation transporter [Staphylothermus hellenicus DSM 12710]
MNWRGIVKIIGALEIVVGLLMLSVPLIDLLTFKPLTLSFTFFALFLILLGYYLQKIEAKPVGLLDGIVATSVAWPLISFESSIPLMLSLNISFVDAWFESISGFTGTGFTVLAGLDYMKPSIVTWRSIMQWSGELGVVVFAMVLFPYFYRLGASAYGVERPLKIEASFYMTARKLIRIYLILTIAGIVSYVYAGMNFYEAFNHVLTTVATGGMSTYDAGYQVIFERAPITYIPVMVLMFLGGMNFVLLDKLLRGDLGRVWRSEEFKTYLYTMLVLVFLTIISYHFVDHYDLYYSLLAGPFNLVSAMTTTGFSIGSISDLSATAKLVLTASMYFGGMIFSTAGGIKSFRLLLILKKFKYSSISTILGGKAEKTLRVDGKPIDESEVSQALLFAFIHSLAIFMGATFMTIYGYSFVDTLFEATSAAGCVGLSVGVVSPTAPLGVKLTIMTLMLLGRVEYIQVITIFGYLAGRKAVKILK